MLYNVLNKKFDNFILNKIIDYKNGDKIHIRNLSKNFFNDLKNYDSIASLKCDFCKRIDSNKVPRLFKYKTAFHQLCIDCYYKTFYYQHKINCILIFITIFITLLYFFNLIEKIFPL